MGCDIHCHVEIKVDNRWLHYNHPRVDRSYRLFSKMAGVRNEEPGDKWYVEPLSPPKGMPDDASETTLLDYRHWDGDAHSASWLGSKEIVELEKWYETIQDPKDYHGLEGRFGYLFGNSLAGFHKYPEDQPEFLQDVRLVFWFDN